MKCPECDLEQPDNTIVCAKCGLDFQVWREANPEPVMAAPTPPPGPEPPSPVEVPAPSSQAEEPVPGALKETAAGVEASSRGSSSGSAGSLGEPAPTAPDLALPAKKKAFKWKPIYSIGLGLIAMLAPAALFFTHRASWKDPDAVKALPSPVVPLTPNSSLTPDVTPAVSPLVTDIPVNGLVPDTPTPDTRPVPRSSNGNEASPKGDFTSTPQDIPPPPGTPAAGTGTTAASTPDPSKGAGASPSAVSPQPTPAITAPAATPGTPTGPVTPVGSPVDILELSQPSPTPTTAPTPGT